MVRSLIWLSAVLAAGASAQPTMAARSAEPVRGEVRAAVEAHRAQRRMEARQEIEINGRRLTAEERHQLREQLRQQWTSPPEVLQTAPRQPADRLARGGVAPAQRVQRN